MNSLTNDMSSVSINNENDTNNKTKSNNSKSKKYKKKVKETTTAKSYIYPQYHETIAEELSNMTFYDNTRGSGFIKEYDTNIMGTFKCSSNECDNETWSSKKIATNIRLYSNGRYNAVVYNQRCISCNTLGILTIDVNSYTERVLYRLKKWLGYQVKAPFYSGNSKKPHESELCEGCKAGHCSEKGNRVYNSYY